MPITHQLSMSLFIMPLSTTLLSTTLSNTMHLCTTPLTSMLQCPTHLYIMFQCTMPPSTILLSITRASTTTMHTMKTHT